MVPKKEQQTKEPAQETPRRKTGNKRGLYVTVALLVLGGLYIGTGYLLSINSFLVETISFSGNNVLVSADVVPLVEEELVGYSVWPYKKASIFLTPKRAIKEKIFSLFGRVADVSIKKRGLQEIEIVIQEREGGYLWCGGIADMSLLEHECFVLDGKGIIFDKAPDISGDAYFKIFGGDVSVEDPMGKEVISLPMFNTIIDIKERLSDESLLPVALLLEDDESLSFVIKTEGRSLYDGARVKFTLLVDHLEAINNLVSALHSSPLDVEMKEKGKNLDYIDARFNNRVYYKFRD